MNTTEKEPRLYRMGCLAFFFSGICAMSSGVIVSLLQEHYGFAYGMTGTLLSLMNIGNLAGGFASGALPAKIGTRATVLTLTLGYALGYLFMTSGNFLWLIALAFLLLGLAKGNTINNCTVLVGNHAPHRTKGMNVMHASYACGALLGPILISAALLFGDFIPMYALALMGLLLWLTFVLVRFPGRENGAGAEAKRSTDWGFLQEKKFWLLTALIFCQNAAETSVTGWLVTYYKGNGILSGTLANYTITIMWSATLVARLLIAFVFPIRDRFRALAVMGCGCVFFYALLMCSNTGWLAILMLFCFSFSMAGVNPTGVAGAGNMLNATSMAIMLPTAGFGAILFPWIIGIVAEHVSLQAGMLCNLVPCAGIFVFSLLCKRLEK
jgi:fucose permease